jgi:hypothetical protein
MEEASSENRLTDGKPDHSALTVRLKITTPVLISQRLNV